MLKNICPGQLVYWRNRPAIVLELKGLTDAILKMIDDSTTELAYVPDLSRGLAESKEAPTAPHLLAAEKDWNLALQRFEVIRPLLEKPDRTLQDVQNVAKLTQKSPTTIYRWLAKFEEAGLVSSLLRSPRSDIGNGRISKEVDDIIEMLINSYYLTEERRSVLALYRQIEIECVGLGLDVPNKNTVYARVKDINRRVEVSKRYGLKKAREQFEPLRGKFPGADFPNAVVQIDHTPVDVIIVDEKHRLPIKRPYLTLSIDVTTKMVTGFNLSLDPPSALSAGLCVAHAVIRKDHWLAKRDIDAEWPIYGKMRKIHLDNAKEFHGKMLERACRQHDIILEYRPKGQPNYGPHIERAFRTFMKECQALPGTTFSNVQAKLDYDSEGKACFTLAELELWLTIFFVYVYHHRPHTGISSVPPINRYLQLVHGTSEVPGVGLPEAIENEENFRLDFTPYKERTIQRDGVVIDYIQYYAPVLRKWVDAPDLDNPNKGRKFIFVRDPRDISLVYFLDPDTKIYTPVPYFTTTRPPISAWELNAEIRRLKEDPHCQPNEEMIFKGILKMREIEAKAIEKTKLAKQSRAGEKRLRTMAERRNGWEGAHKDKKKEAPAVSVADDSDEEPIEAFNDIRMR